MQIVLNKWDGVGIGATCPKPASLPSLDPSILSMCMGSIVSHLCSPYIVPKVMALVNKLDSTC